MDLKVGDKVRYLDAVGGGTITAFKGKDLVLVLEDDGFETPVLKRQCVVVESAGGPASAGKKPSEPVAVQEKSSAPVIQLSGKPSAYPETRAGEQLNISLAFLPAEGTSVVDGQFECYLINESNYTLLFNYASCSGKTWKSRHAASIEPNSKLFIEDFGKETIPDLEKVSLQYIAFKPGGYYTFKNAQSVEIRMDIVKFYKIHCFRENDFFEDDALIIPVVKNDVPERSLHIEAEEIRKAMLDKTPPSGNKTSQPLPQKNSPVEVDLHINQLLDTTAGMDNAAILNYQLGVFRKTMDEHLSRKGTKIVFIHGKGDGVLRSAIVSDLKTNYRTCKYQDASFREYGFGATMVIIA